MIKHLTPDITYNFLLQITWRYVLPLPDVYFRRGKGGRIDFSVRGARQLRQNHESRRQHIRRKLLCQVFLQSGGGAFPGDVSHQHRIAMGGGAECHCGISYCRMGAQHRFYLFQLNAKAA